MLGYVTSTETERCNRYKMLVFTCQIKCLVGGLTIDLIYSLLNLIEADKRFIASWPDNETHVLTIVRKLVSVN